VIEQYGSIWQNGSHDRNLFFSIQLSVVIPKSFQFHPSIAIKQWSVSTTCGLCGYAICQVSFELKITPGLKPDFAIRARYQEVYERMFCSTILSIVVEQKYVTLIGLKALAISYES
jgi:hypothetical protein